MVANEERVWSRARKGICAAKSTAGSPRNRELTYGAMVMAPQDDPHRYLTATTSPDTNATIRKARNTVSMADARRDEPERPSCFQTSTLPLMTATQAATKKKPSS